MVVYTVYTRTFNRQLLKNSVFRRMHEEYLKKSIACKHKLTRVNISGLQSDHSKFTSAQTWVKIYYLLLVHLGPRVLKKWHGMKQSKHPWVEPRAAPGRAGSGPNPSLLVTKNSMQCLFTCLKALFCFREHVVILYHHKIQGPVIVPSSNIFSYFVPAQRERLLFFNQERILKAGRVGGWMAFLSVICFSINHNHSKARPRVCT